jgi:diacylglycerol kinase (ATP)
MPAPDPHPPLLIVNPTAGRGRWGANGLTPATTDRVLAVLRERWPRIGVATTTQGGADPALPGTGAALAAAAVRGGAPAVFAAGGDGTIHDVAAGFVAAVLEAKNEGEGGEGGPPPPPVFGILPAGSGNDFAAGLGLPADPVAAARWAVEAAARTEGAGAPTDVGLVECAPLQDGGGGGTPSPSTTTTTSTVRRHFLNISSTGASAASAGTAPRLTPYIGRLAYLVAGAVAAVRAWAAAPAVDVAVQDEAGGSHARTLRCLTFLAVASSSTFGGGVVAAPGADPGSGSFQVVAITPGVAAGLGVFRLRQGWHLRRRRLEGSETGGGSSSDAAIASHPHHHDEWEPAQRGVRVWNRAVRVSAALAPLPPGGRPPPPELLRVECEGEVVGSLPATWTVLPGAIRMLR